MKRLPIQPDEHLERDWELVKEDHLRLYAWSVEDLERRAIACEEIRWRASSSGCAGVAAESERLAEAWGRVRRELVVCGLQASLDLAAELTLPGGGL